MFKAIYTLALTFFVSSAAGKGFELSLSAGLCTNTKLRATDQRVAIVKGEPVITTFSPTGAIALNYAINNRWSIGLRGAVMPWEDTYFAVPVNTSGKSVYATAGIDHFKALAFSLAPVVKWKFSEKSTSLFVDALVGIARTNGSTEELALINFRPATGITTGLGFGSQSSASKAVDASLRIGAEFAYMKYGNSNLKPSNWYHLFAFPVTFALAFKRG